MKHVILLAFSLTTLSAYSFETTESTQVVNNEAINVDGVVVEKAPSDPELESIKAEIVKQKQETILNKHKSKGFQELSKSVVKLSTTTEEYLLQKRAAHQQIAEYNEKVRCLQDDDPGRECDKYLKNKKQ